MPRKKKQSESHDEMPELLDGPVEVIPEIPTATKNPHLRALTKEFDLKAAHHAWKERHGIDPDDMW
jgi:hypothetical protein